MTLTLALLIVLTTVSVVSCVYLYGYLAGMNWTQHVFTGKHIRIPFLFRALRMPVIQHHYPAKLVYREFVSIAKELRERGIEGEDRDITLTKAETMEFASAVLLQTLAEAEALAEKAYKKA